MSGGKEARKSPYNFRGNLFCGLLSLPVMIKPLCVVEQVPHLSDLPEHLDPCSVQWPACR